MAKGKIKVNIDNEEDAEIIKNLYPKLDILYDKKKDIDYVWIPKADVEKVAQNIKRHKKGIGLERLLENEELTNTNTKSTTIGGIDKTYAGLGAGALVGALIASEVVYPLIEATLVADPARYSPCYDFYGQLRNAYYVATTLFTLLGGVFGGVCGFLSKQPTKK